MCAKYNARDHALRQSHAVQVGQHALKSDEGAAAAAALLAQCPSIVKAGAKQLQDKSPRTRAGMFQVPTFKSL